MARADRPENLPSWGLLTGKPSSWYDRSMEVTYTVHIEPAEEGGYVAHFPALPGCHTQGDTLDEVMAMAKDALAGYLAWLQEEGAPIPREIHAAKRVGFDFPLSMSVSR